MKSVHSIRASNKSFEGEFLGTTKAFAGKASPAELLAKKMELMTAAQIIKEEGLKAATRKAISIIEQEIEARIEAGIW